MGRKKINNSLMVSIDRGEAAGQNNIKLGTCPVLSFIKQFYHSPWWSSIIRQIMGLLNLKALLWWGLAALIIQIQDKVDIFIKNSDDKSINNC